LFAKGRFIASDTKHIGFEKLITYGQKVKAKFKKNYTKFKKCRLNDYALFFHIIPQWTWRAVSFSDFNEYLSQYAFAQNMVLNVETSV
jgi:hypothetical protein